MTNKVKLITSEVYNVEREFYVPEEFKSQITKVAFAKLNFIHYEQESVFLR